MTRAIRLVSLPGTGPLRMARSKRGLGSNGAENLHSSRRETRRLLGRDWIGTVEPEETVTGALTLTTAAEDGKTPFFEAAVDLGKSCIAHPMQLISDRRTTIVGHTLVRHSDFFF
jgi:hypothetical protein